MRSLPNPRSIAIRPMVIPAEVTVTIEAIPFSGVVIVDLEIDGMSFFQIPALEGGLVYFKELLRSATGDGEYLIFTGTTGIADSGGWSRVSVRYENQTVHWTVDRDPHPFICSFAVDQYRQQIRAAAAEIERLRQEYPIEPVTVLFPGSEGYTDGQATRTELFIDFQVEEE